MRRPVVRSARATRRQGGGRREAWPRQFDLRQRRRGHLVEVLDIKETAVAPKGGRLLLGCHALALATPAEMFEPPFRHPALPPIEALRRIVRQTRAELGFVLERQQGGVAAGGGGVDRKGALGCKAMEIVRAAGLGS